MHLSVFPPEGAGAGEGWGITPENVLENLVTSGCQKSPGGALRTEQGSVA